MIEKNGILVIQIQIRYRMRRGKLVISLDFELHWGGAEKWNLKEKEDYFKATRELIPDILKLFRDSSVHATWATVGFLFAKDKENDCF